MKSVERVESKYLMVELHNYAHLKAAYGDSLAAEAMRVLQVRARLWGAQ